MAKNELAIKRIEKTIQQNSSMAATYIQEANEMRDEMRNFRESAKRLLDENGQLMAALEALRE